MPSVIGSELQPLNQDPSLRSNDQELRRALAAVYSRGAFAITTRIYTSSESLDPRISIALCDSSGGAFTITLPYANYWGSNKSPAITFIHYSGAAAVTIAASGSDTINGAANYSLTAGARIDLVSDGVSKWYIFASSSSGGPFVDESGDTMTGSLLFSADNSHDIGASGATRPRDIHIGRNLNVGGAAAITANATIGTALGVGTTLSVGTDMTVGGVAGFANGSAAAPSVTFTSDTDTGLYRMAANKAGISVAGAAMFSVSTLGIGSEAGIYAGDGLIGTPAYTFNNDTDTGIYRSGANVFELVGGGLTRVQVGPSGRTYVIGNSEAYGFGVTYSSTGGAVYFGATDATATPGFQISQAAGASWITGTNGGNVGIGVVAPKAKFEAQVTSAAPASSGDQNTGITIHAGYGGPGLNMGMANGGVGSSYGWLQSAFTNNAGVFETLALQPLGGSVGIGVLGPATYKLQVYSSTLDSQLGYFHLAKNNGGTGVGFTILDDRGFSGNMSGTTFEVATRNDGSNDTGAIANFRTIAGDSTDIKLGIRKGLDITQSHTNSSATANSSYRFNTITCTATNMNLDTAAGAPNPFNTALRIEHFITGTSSSGGHNSLEVYHELQTATDHDNFNRNYCAAFFSGYASASDIQDWSAAVTYNVGSYAKSGGTKYRCILSHTNQTPPNATYWTAVAGEYVGAVFGINPVGSLGALAKDFQNVTAAEFNTNCISGASVYYRSLIQLTGQSTDAVQGSTYDAMISLGGTVGSVGYKVGILFSEAHGTDPLSSDGTLILTSGSDSITTGIDISSYTISGNAWKSTNITIDGTGRINTTGALGAAYGLTIENTSNSAANQNGGLFKIARQNADSYGLVVQVAGNNYLLVSGDANDPISIWVNGASKQVTVGASDSGGVGYRYLRVPN